jgi:hypothetical protein
VTRDEILSATPESPWTDIDIPEWGGKFLLKPLSGGQAEEVSLLNLQAKQTGQLMCLQGLAGRVTTWTVCSPDRVLLFKPSDAPALTNRHLQVCVSIYTTVLKANKIAADAEEVDAAEKNSESIQTSGPGCTSPEPSPTAPSPNAKSE